MWIKFDLSPKNSYPVKRSYPATKGGVTHGSWTLLRRAGNPCRQEEAHPCGSARDPEEAPGQERVGPSRQCQGSEAVEGGKTELEASRERDASFFSFCPNFQADKRRKFG